MYFLWNCLPQTKVLSLPRLLKLLKLSKDFISVGVFYQRTLRCFKLFLTTNLSYTCSNSCWSSALIWNTTFRELNYQKIVFLYQKFPSTVLKAETSVARYSGMYLYSDSVTRKIEDTCDGEYEVLIYRFQVGWLL